MSIVGNNRIVKPVNFYDVRRVLGVNEGNEGLLCISPRINKWARFKPVNVGGRAALTHQTITNENFGLKLITASTWNDFKTKLDAFISLVYGSAQQVTIDGVTYHRGDWDDGVYYKHPQGANESPAKFYRITDFVSRENANLGYQHNAQLLFTLPNYAQDYPTVGAISSEINPLIDYSDNEPKIDMNDLQDQQILPDDSSILNGFNLPLSIEGKTSTSYNNVSVHELIKKVWGGAAQRNVVLVDAAGFVSEFGSVDANGRPLGYIPWGVYKSSQDECTLYGEWICCEFYSGYNGGSYCLIPKFQYKVFFDYGSGGSTITLAFAKDPAIGICLAEQQYKMYIGFCQLTSEDITNTSIWSVTTKLYKYINGVKSMITSIPLSSYQSYVSGARWFYTYVNVDYGTQSQAGDKFELEIEYTCLSPAQSAKSFYLTNIVLTV